MFKLAFQTIKSMKNIKHLAFLLILFPGMSLISQTAELEQEHMMNRYISKELSQLEYKDIVFAWRDMMDSTEYPVLPYDPATKRIEYEFKDVFPGIAFETIVNRVSEWAAISYGSTNSLLTYQGNTSSRIILNGSFEILFPDLFFDYKNAWKGYVETEFQNSGTCYFTAVFTIRDEKLKSQFLNIYYVYTDYLTDQTISRTLNSCFPISRFKQNEWRDIFGLILETRVGFEAQISMLADYIKDYENDYNW
jgi:hypothetical protein